MRWKKQCWLWSGSGVAKQSVKAKVGKAKVDERSECEYSFRS
jgi:hypothetical protein